MSQGMYMVSRSSERQKIGFLPGPPRRSCLADSNLSPLILILVFWCPELLGDVFCVKPPNYTLLAAMGNIRVDIIISI